MPLDVHDISHLVNNLSQEEFNLLREAVYKRIVNDLKETENVKEKILTKEKPKFLWDND